MRLDEFCETYGLCAAAGVMIILGYDVKGHYEVDGKINHLRKKGLLPEIPVPTIQDTVECMDTLNKLVKMPSVPSNVRNKFYSKKHQLINRCIHSGLVDKIVESENHYRFDIFGKEFHQPKKYYQTPFETTETENYIPKPAPDTVWDEDLYIRFNVGCLVEIAKKQMVKESEDQLTKKLKNIEKSQQNDSK